LKQYCAPKYVADPDLEDEGKKYDNCTEEAEVEDSGRSTHLI
jgi:hypothetical protein